MCETRTPSQDNSNSFSKLVRTKKREPSYSEDEGSMEGKRQACNRNSHNRPLQGAYSI